MVSKDYKPLDASKYPFEAAGLLGPVALETAVRDAPGAAGPDGVEGAGRSSPGERIPSRLVLSPVLSPATF